MIYEIFDQEGNIINRIVANKDFVDKKYPGRYRGIKDFSAPKPLIITKVAFRFRLTDSEYVSILSAAKNDTEVQAWVETFSMVSKIDLEDQRLMNGISMMVDKGLITLQRANEILITPIEDFERPEEFRDAISL